MEKLTVDNQSVKQLHIHGSNGGFTQVLALLSLVRRCLNVLQVLMSDDVCDCDGVCCLKVPRADLTHSSVLTPDAVSRHHGSVMEIMIVETCLMNRTAESPLHSQVNIQGRD